MRPVSTAVKSGHRMAVFLPVVMAGCVWILSAGADWLTGGASGVTAADHQRMAVNVTLLALLDEPQPEVQTIPNLGIPVEPELPAFALKGNTRVHILSEFSVRVDTAAGVEVKCLIPDMFAAGKMMSAAIRLDDLADRSETDGPSGLHIGHIGLQARRLGANGSPGGPLYPATLKFRTDLRAGFRSLFHAPRLPAAGYDLALLVSWLPEEATRVELPVPVTPGILSLDDLISLTCHGVTLAEVFSRLGPILGKGVDVDREAAPMQRRVDLAVRDAPLRGILDDLAEMHEFTYEVTDDRLQIRFR